MTPDRTPYKWSLVARTGVPDDPVHAGALRDALVRDLVSLGDARTPRVVSVLRTIPRHLFAPNATLLRAYVNRPLSIGHGHTLAPPSTIARMTEALGLAGEEHVLEVGTGSGYIAAIVSLLARDVFTVEPDAALAAEAKERFARLGYRNIHARAGDACGGWPEAAPFDRILVTTALAEIPPALLEQLADGGGMVIPIGGAGAPVRLVRVDKRGDSLVRADLGSLPANAR